MTMNLTEQQINQISNIFHTLIELTDHLHAKVKEKDIPQSVQTFSALVEGYVAVEETIQHFQQDHMLKMKNQLNHQLSLLASFFEQKNLLKVNEVLQFSFSPTLRKITVEIERYTVKSEEVIIGVFNALRNPKDFYPWPRTKALIEESEKQQATLLFFTSSDVDLENNCVNGYIYTNGEWQKIESRLPDVINNVGVGKRTYVERVLRRTVPFTSFHVGNKLSLPKRLLENRKYAELLVPFTVCIEENKVHNFMQRNAKVVFKALGSNRGENIYFVTRVGQRYVVAEHKKEEILTQEKFNQWLQSIILAEKGSYIVQKFILTRTKADEPYHFRAHVQKNGEGKWGLTFIYPRIGSKRSNLSNVASDGRIEDFHEFMINEFDENGPKYEEDILRLSVEVAEHLDKIYGFAIDELGLDFAIDETGRYWMHEANNGPQTAFHEEKRAVNTISYAKYVAESGLFYDEAVRKSREGMFQAKLSKLPYARLDKNQVVGLLVSEIDLEDSLINHLLKKVKDTNLVPVLFKPLDVDYDYALIKAHIFQDDEWQERIIEYPDILIDYSFYRYRNDNEWIYDEFREIPLINEYSPSNTPLNTLYSSLRESKEVAQYIPSYEIIQNVRDVTRLLEQVGQITIKNRFDKLQKGVVILQETETRYTIIQQDKKLRYNKLQLINFLKDQLKGNENIVQEFTRSNYQDEYFSVITNLVRIKDTWISAGQYVKNDLEETFDVKEVLSELYDDFIVETLVKEINIVTENIANLLYEKHHESISLLSIEVGITEEGLKVLSMDLNTVRCNGMQEIYAQALMQRVALLLNNN